MGGGGLQSQWDYNQEKKKKQDLTSRYLILHYICLCYNSEHILNIACLALDSFKSPYE